MKPNASARGIFGPQVSPNRRYGTRAVSVFRNLLRCQSLFDGASQSPELLLFVFFVPLCGSISFFSRHWRVVTTA